MKIMRILLTGILVSFTASLLAQVSLPGVVYRGGSGDGYDYTRIVSELYISSDKSALCLGDTVAFRLIVQDGTGPWQVELSPPVIDPFVLHARDTLIRYLAQQSDYYTIARVTDMGDGMEGMGIGAVDLDVHTDFVRFTSLADTHVGHCNEVNLFDKLRPAIGDAFLQTGSFNVNKQKGVTIWYPEYFQPGAYTVSYHYADDIGCESEAVTKLFVDTLPTATLLVPDKNICMGNTGTVQVSARGNGVSFDLERFRYGNGLITTTERYKLANGGQPENYVETVSFLADDKYVVYKVRNVKDRYGCEPQVPKLLSDTIYQRRIPEIYLEQQYPLSSAWQELEPEIWTWRDSAHIRGTLVSGVTPFRVVVENTDGSWRKELQSKGTTKQVVGGLINEGVYRVRVNDRYCADDTKPDFRLSYKRPAYVRIKSFLEGFYEENTGIMSKQEKVLVELYKKEAADENQSELKLVASDSCLLHKDGTVTDLSGSGFVRFSDYGLQGNADSCYIVVRHGGHLSAMSSKSYQMASDPVLAPFVDLTDSLNLQSSTHALSVHMSRVGRKDGKEVWALSAWDDNANDLITVRDANRVVMKKDIIDEKVYRDLRITKQNRSKYTGIK